MDNFGSTDLQSSFDDFGTSADAVLQNYLEEPNDFFQPNTAEPMAESAGTIGQQQPPTSRPTVVVSVATSAPTIVQDTIVTTTTSAKKKQSKVTGGQRKKKDPNAPAGPSSAYALFFRDKQAAIKAQNPAAKFGDISKIVASLWDALGEEEKSVYRKRNEADKIRYKEEMKAYESGKLVAKNNKSADPEEINEDAKQVFSSTSDLSTHLTFQQMPEETTNNQCIKAGCTKLAILSTEWDGEYCSNSCCVGHCKDIFAAWVADGS